MKLRYLGYLFLSRVLAFFGKITTLLSFGVRV